MSVEPQALERSVLERKERDELAAIAEAMGVKTGARTSKANLIGQILREAGIETGDDKPKRATKAKSDNGAETEAPTEVGAEASSEQPAAAETTTEQKPDVNVVPAKAEASSEVGGTSEGCKCSADGMKCATKPGDKGCCGAKDGACTTMAEGKSECCKSKGSASESCCSAAGKMAANDKNACNPGTTKPATAPATKKG